MFRRTSRPCSASCASAPAETALRAGRALGAAEFDGLRGVLLNQPFDPESFVAVGDEVVLRGYKTEDGPEFVLVARFGAPP